MRYQMLHAFMVKLPTLVQLISDNQHTPIQWTGVLHLKMLRQSACRLALPLM